ncbi:MAG: DNA polymerase III subunit beta [Candidatus Harrisonbacteria bacterium]|nr:DNA polymerase III subunit beta [Candidatus Harrisonbacteria bacterium]
MKLIILRENLKEALSRVERAVTENNNLPVLRNILLSAENQLFVSATNLELGVRSQAAAKINQKGSLTIPFAPLYSIVVNSTSERINLEAEKETLVVKTDNYEAKIQGTKAEEFPILPNIKDRNSFISIQFSILKDTLEQVSPAAQISDLKPELSGVLFDFQVGQIKFVATDSYRLAEKSLLNTSFNSTQKEAVRAIVPLTTIQELLRVFNEDEEIKIFLDETQILFESEKSYLISRLIDGEYPDYQAIVPKEHNVEFTIEKTDFFNALKLVNSFSGRTNDVRLKLASNEKALELYASNQSVGENNYLVPVKKEGETFEPTSFNARYLIDGLRIIRAETILLQSNGPTKPVLIKPSGDKSFFYIVMPLES